MKWIRFLFTIAAVVWCAGCITFGDIIDLIDPPDEEPPSEELPPWEPPEEDPPPVEEPPVEEPPTGNAGAWKPPPSEEWPHDRWYVGLDGNNACPYHGVQTKWYIERGSKFCHDCRHHYETVPPYMTIPPR